MKGLSLVIPAHNSEKVIEKTLNSYYEAFSKKFKKFEMIVICNDCWDNTYKICTTLEKELPIKIIRIPQRGKGYALVKGFTDARYEVLGFLDADNSFDLEKVSKMINLLERVPIVIASKYLPGDNKKQDSFQRRLISLGGNIISKIFFNLPSRDTQAGAKFFTLNAWKKITEKNKKFICNGFDWDIEFLYRARKNNLKIAEVYIPVKSKKFSTFRLKYLPGIVKRLLVLRFLK